MNVLTSTGIFAFGIYFNSVKQSVESLAPSIVPIPDVAPAPVMIFPYSVKNTRSSSSIIITSANSYVSFKVSLI